ncbi:MAG: altronate dehydratase [Ruminococcaceae bacterium]|nr:altronate dehydratase [Oscillospiraceae bacterium]
MKNTLIIDQQDNVGVRLVAGGGIPAGHKYALTAIPEGAEVIKYGAVIGRATAPIAPGEWVHTHNLRSHLDEEAAYTYTPRLVQPAPQKGTFMGYPRQGRRAGIRNEIYIIPTVGCVNGVCQRLQQQAQALVTGSIDGIFALPHQFGCSQLGEDNENIRALLCGVARNPNASFVLFVGLGCENNRLDGIIEELREDSADGHIAFYNTQDVEDEVGYGLEILRDFAAKAAVLQRQPVDLAEVCIGLKCGGSDGYSGITANPLVGRISDRLVAHGGAAVLTEVPEMFGAEQRLMDKCCDRAVFEAYRQMIVDFKKSYTDQGFPVYENPSPGNKDGGITTLEEKSLGCVEKAGTSPIVDVLPYGGQVRKAGVTALNAPGNDLIAATALAAAGCQVVLFTTGRGTPFSTFVPTMKIASNDALAQRKAGWIDFSAASMDEDGLWEKLLGILNGTVRCHSEDVREIAFYKTGVTL